LERSRQLAQGKRGQGLRASKTSKKKKKDKKRMVRLVVLFGKGGLSDVGRHAVQASLEQSQVTNIKVLTEYPELLEESNWKCGCPEPHVFSEHDRERFQVVPIKSWKSALKEMMDDSNNNTEPDSVSACFEGATAVIACVGNRQPFIGGWDAHAASQVVVQAMKINDVKRVVSISSGGVQEDWPPFESFKPGKIIMSFMFTMPGLSRRAYQDLTAMEQEYQNKSKADLDYLLVRPYGLGEDVIPVNKWWIQKKKYDDVVGINLAKLDCARFMVQEALHPTLHEKAIVIGGDPDAPIN
jgi:NAD(P)H-binding